jgi:hypothetical protein
VVGRALVPEQPAAVGLLEAEIHLEAAPVWAARIRPAPLVVVDAEPRVEPRWMVRPPPHRVLSLPPGVGEPPQPDDRGLRGPHRKQAHGPRRRTAANDGHPAPGAGPVVPDMTVPAGDDSRRGVRAARPGLRRRESRGRGGRGRRCGGTRRAVSATQPGGAIALPPQVDSKSEAERAGTFALGEHRSARLMRSLAARVATNAT